MNFNLPILLWQGDIPIPDAPYKQTNIFFDSAKSQDIMSISQSYDFLQRESNKCAKAMDLSCDEQKNSNTHKNLVIFIGGLMDSYHRVVFREFAQFQQESYPKLAHIPFGAKIYTTFNHKNLFTSWLPFLVDSGYHLYIFAHSWGAANICKVISRLNLTPASIPLLTTMDPVGYWIPRYKPQGIKLWVNLYIADKWQHITPPNICTYIGHAWNHSKAADVNISIKNYHSHTKSDKNSKIIAHASIRTMMQYFNTSNLFEL